MPRKGELTAFGTLASGGLLVAILAAVWGLRAWVVAAIEGSGRQRASAGGAGTRDSNALQDERAAAIDDERRRAESGEGGVPGDPHTHT